MSDVREYADKSVFKQIISLSLPILGFLAVEPILLATDAIYVGHIGVDELAALSIATILIHNFCYLFIFLTYDNTTKVSVKYAQGNINQAYFYGIQSFWVSACIGVFIAIFITAFSYELSVLLGANKTVSLLVQEYMYYCAPAIFCITVCLSCVGTIRGMLKNTVVLIFSVVSALVNIVLTGIFIYYFDMKIAGAGLATSIAEAILCLSLTYYLISKAIGEGVSLKPSTKAFNNIFSGLPIFIRTLTLRVSFIATAFVIAKFGTIAIAGNEVISSVLTVFAILLEALSMACQSLVALSIGLKNKNYTNEIVRKCLYLTLGISVILGSVVVLSSSVIPVFFTTSAQLISLLKFPLVILGILLPLIAFVYITDGILFGANDTVYLAKAGFINVVGYVTLLGVASNFIPMTNSLTYLSLTMILGLYGFRAITNGWRIFSSNNYFSK